MSLHGNWGDKITLQALSDFFGVVINVITSARYDAYLQCIHLLVIFWDGLFKFVFCPITSFTEKNLNINSVPKLALQNFVICYTCF